MNDVALSLGEARRREVALNTMRDARESEGRLRLAAGAVLMAVGQRIGGELPATMRAVQTTSGDCL